jgi:hypothetical protein
MTEQMPRSEDQSEPVTDATPSEEARRQEQRSRRQMTSAEDVVVGAGPTGGGGNPPGAVTTSPDVDVPDPLGGEDEERERQRRTE